jgi:uncharacterized protein
LQYGTLPKIYLLSWQKQVSLAKEHLRSYISTYIKEEIQAEALTRNIGSFNRFLNVAAQCNGQIIEISNISRECSVPASTVKEYFQILEDTLLGFFLWPWSKSERKKARPKFYFFDCGVVRAIQNRLNDPPSPPEKGFLFETWFINELIRIRDYSKAEHEFSFWRNRDQEIDIIISKGSSPIMAFECKSGRVDVNSTAINSFKKVFPKAPLTIVSLTDHLARKVDNAEILPIKEAIKLYSKMC